MVKCLRQIRLMKHLKFLKKNKLKKNLLKCLGHIRLLKCLINNQKLKKHNQKLQLDKEHIDKSNLLRDMVAYALQVVEEVDTSKPTTYQEAMTSNELAQWILAMGEKMESLHKN